MNEDRLQLFLYLLMRDHLPCGRVEAIMQALRECDQKKWHFSAQQLAIYAGALADEIRGTQ